MSYTKVRWSDGQILPSPVGNMRLLFTHQVLLHFKQAREELATYQPWGRAGGGAPNPRGVRFTNLRDKGIFPEDELRVWTLCNVNTIL